MAAFARCPHCRQIIGHERCGVRLTPLKAELFDIIKRAGDIGVTSVELIHSALYRDRRTVSHLTVKSHIWQINELLEETDWVIQSEADYGTSERRWHLRRRKVRRVA
jgi:hypothetical protein